VVPAVAHALDALMVRQAPLLVPRAVTVMAAPVALPLPRLPGTHEGNLLAPGMERHR
jgi:hypothetical protein